MNPSIIKFHHFTTKRNYCKLQEIFGAFDFKNNYDSIEKPYKDFVITYYERDEFTNKEDYKDLSFRNDFLIPGISQLKNQYFESFKSATYEKGVFTQELMDGFSKHHRNKLKETQEIIMNSKYIELKIRVTINNEIYKLIELIDDFISNPYSHLKNKLEFNWKRIDVEYFFYLLRENKVISNITEADLGKIIDGMCKFVKADEYLPILGSRTHLNDFKNNTSIPLVKANERLKKVFNDDFFNI